MTQSTAQAQVSSLSPLRATLAVVVIVCVVISALAEGAMMSQFGADPQLPIWWASFAIKTLFWLITGLWIAWLVSLRWPRGLFALPFLILWAAGIMWTSFHYWEGRQALADAKSPSTSPERLTELSDFQGLQAGYELDNRLATNPNTPTSVLRELHGRKNQAGTEMALAANPNTPADILRELSKHEDEWVRRQLARNPALTPDIIERLASDSDKQVREQLANNPSASGAKILR